MGSVNLNLAPKSRVWTRAADEFLIIWAELIGGGARLRSKLDMREIGLRQPDQPPEPGRRIRLIDNEAEQNK